MEQENTNSGAGKGTADAECVDVGGGSFYIDCIETSNQFACLAEDDECAQPESQWGRMFACSDWTDWREYYSSIPAPPPTLTFANVTVIKKRNSLETRPLRKQFQAQWIQKAIVCHLLRQNGFGRTGKHCGTEILSRNARMNVVERLQQVLAAHVLVTSVQVLHQAT